MNLYLLRHGEAVPPNGTMTDAERTLSDRGRTDIERVGRILSRLTPAVARVVTSPLVRAVETAEIVSSVIPWHPAVSRSGNLVPGFRVKDFLGELADLKEENLLAVGHQPDLTALDFAPALGTPARPRDAAGLPCGGGVLPETRRSDRPPSLVAAPCVDQIL